MKNIYLALTLIVSTTYAYASAKNNEPDSLKHKHIKELTVFGINATVLNSEPSGHAWVKLFI